MLIILSDLHLTDTSIGLPPAPQTFSLFARRLREQVYQASWRSDGRYRPIENVDILLLGDILDPLQSTAWLQRDSQDTSYIRPWHDTRNPLFALTVGRITRQILEKNPHAGQVFRRIASGEALRLPPATRAGQADFSSAERVAPRARLHYMVGNHDWYYHLPGPAFDAIRREMIQAFALNNPPTPFPHDAGESGLLTGLLMEYDLIARHGDIFNNFTYNQTLGRDAASLSDIFACEVILRFPLELERRYSHLLPASALTAAYEMTHVRPLLGAPFWLRSQLQALTTSPRLEKVFKTAWNETIERFIHIEEVRQQTLALGKGKLQALQTLLKITRQPSFKTVAEISAWLVEWFGESNLSLGNHARQERDLLENRAHVVVYGHTHHHEVLALDHAHISPYLAKHVYINSGSWGTYHDSIQNTTTNLLTCVTLYRQDERGGRKFETWQVKFT